MNLDVRQAQGRERGIAQNPICRCLDGVEAGTAAVPTANSPASDDNLKHGKKFKDTVKIGV